MKSLRHHGVDESRVHEDTQHLRWSDPRTSSWVSTTQVWSWDNGDAIVVIVGNTPFVVIRNGDKVQILPADSVNAAMASVGLDPDGYRVVPGRMAS
jgi:hypothetical protein